MEPRNDNIQEMIDRYFEGRLSGEDKIQFEKQLENPEFRKTFEFHQKMAKGLRKDYQNSRLKQLFQAEEKKMAKRVQLRQRLSIAAGVLILVVAGFVFFQNDGQGPVINGETNLQAIAELQKNPRDWSKKTGAEGQVLENPNEACAQLYSVEEDYAQALNCFTELVNSGKGDIESQYYIGNCHFKLGNYTAALKNFKQVADSGQLEPDSPESKQLEWNMLVTEVLTAENPGDYLDEVSQLLQNPGYKYYMEAERLSKLLSPSADQ